MTTTIQQEEPIDPKEGDRLFHSHMWVKETPLHFIVDKDNQSKMQEKKGNGKMKKDTGKLCDFHKIPWHNTDECRSK